MVYVYKYYKSFWYQEKRSLMNLFMGCAVLVYVTFALSFVSVTLSRNAKLYSDPDVYKFTRQNIIWSYTCQNGQCIKTRVGNSSMSTSLETCSYMCSPLHLWPKPRNISVTSKKSSSFSTDRLFIRLLVPKEIESDLMEAHSIFMNNLPKCPKCVYSPKNSVVTVTISVLQNVRKPKLTTDESYILEVAGSDDVSVNITAPTYFGARHALETLTQLIWYDSVENSLQIFRDLVIDDRPVFPHRGLMIDTARNYYPIELLKRTVDGMAASKLNVLHLHLTDCTSFPIVLPNNPGFAEAGAYSTERVYTPDDIKSLVEYSRIRGIRVVLEIDAPSHVYAGWNQIPTHFGKFLICDDNSFNAVLNPDNPNVFKVLKNLYEDLLELGTDDEYFHLGADEVDTDCYEATQLRKSYDNSIHLWGDYVNNMAATLKSANKNKMPKNVVIWSSDLTSNHINVTNFGKNLVVQFWYGDIYPVLAHGAKVVFSTVGHWYLDCGYGPWKPSMDSAPCGPYTPWQNFYAYRPWDFYPVKDNQVLGGEACLWSETIVPDSLQVRLWPRVSAMAERLWSDPDSVDMLDVYSRISVHRRRLIERNVECDAIWPEWCSQNPSLCT